MNREFLKGKLDRKLIALMLLLSMIGALIMPTVALAAGSQQPDVITDELNNRADEIMSGSVVKSVTSGSDTTTLRVNVGDMTGLTIKVYKIASVTFNSQTNRFNDPTWEPVVEAWIKAQDRYVSSGEIKTAYKNPKNLASASEATWDEFYKFMLLNADSAKGPVNVIDNAVSVSGVDTQLTKIDNGEKTINEAETSSVDFSNLSFGFYAVMVTGTGGKKYNPIVKDLVPYVNGPNSGYFINEIIGVTLKASEATVDKKINGYNSDAVKINEDVNFSVEISLPELYEDRLTHTVAGTSHYKMQIIDDMSQAFTIKDLNTDNTIDTNDVKLYYTFNGADEAAFPTSDQTYYEIADAAYITANSTTLTSGEDYWDVKASGSSDKLYGFDVSTVESEGTYYVLKKTGKIYSVATSDITDASDNPAKRITVTINVGALKQWLKSQTDGYEATKAKLTSGVITLKYSATVTDKIQINSEQNYNTAKFDYEGGAPSDTVRAYTYGLRIIKINGETEGTENIEYVAGAKFKLYKEVNTYLDTSSTSTSNFVFKKNASGGETDILNTLTYAQIKSDFDTNGDASAYYVYETSYDEAGTTASGVSYNANQKVAYVFTRYTDGVVPAYGNTAKYNTSNEIVSIADPSGNGVLVQGLDEGRYILVETEAAATYNKLAEDIMFTISQIDHETAQLNYNGSLAAFLDQEGTMEESGVLSLRVLNYKGLTLPSTGGKGILMFTVLGMILMMASIMVIIIKQRRQGVDYYM